MGTCARFALAIVLVIHAVGDGVAGQLTTPGSWDIRPESTAAESGVISAHRRPPRDLSSILNSVFLYDAIGLGDPQEKERIKRSRIALSKVREEYLRCKKEFTNGNDCMKAFARMYHIAQEITEKMEKMKTIFKESTHLLENNSKSSSHSNESNETPELTPQPIAEIATSPTVKATDETHPPASILTTVTTMATKSSTAIHTKQKKVKLQKIKPSKYSWIIDGHDDSTENFALLDEKPASQHPSPTSQTTLTTVVDSDASTAITSTQFNSDEAMVTTEEPFAQSTPTDEDFDLIVSVPSTQRSTEEAMDTTENPSAETMTSLIRDDPTPSTDTTQADTHGTTRTSGGHSEPRPISTTAQEVTATTEDIARLSPDQSQSKTQHVESDESGESEESEFRRLKIEWILDGGEASVEMDKTNIATTAATVRTTVAVANNESRVEPAALEEQKTIKYDWIIDRAVAGAEATADTSSSKEQTKGSTSVSHSAVPCNITLRTQNGHSSYKCEVHGRTLSFDGEAPHLSSALHVLDNPGSNENLVDSGEEQGRDMKLAGVAKKPESGNSSTVDLYDPNKWEKTFQKDALSQQELIESSAGLDGKSMNQFAPKFNQVNINGFGISDSQFMTLCERMAKNVRHKGGNRGSAAMPQAQSEAYTPSPNVQFTSRGPNGFPVTGETMKASAQFMFNPNFGMPTIPVCFYVTPANMRMVNQAPVWSPSFFGMPGGYGGFNSALIGSGGGGPGSVFFVPQNFGGTGNFLGHTSGSGTGSQSNIPNIFTKNASPQKQQQLFCTYMKNQSNSQPNGSGAGGGGGGGGGGSGLGSSPDQAINGINFSNANFKMRASHASSPTDIIYATYSGAQNATARASDFKCELEGELACYGGNQCVREDAWCNGSVQCADGSDEAACTCRDRLLADRICDGYPDCPLREDEVGCFGCEDFGHSCYSSPEEYEHFNRSTIAMCYSSIERCDGIMNCLNGRDELECSILVSDVSHHMSHSVSSSVGFLYHNLNGDWYPVCNNAEKWANQACAGEGDTIGQPTIEFRALALPGPFIEPSLVGEAHFPQSCQKRDANGELADYVAYVTCPAVQCGVVRRPTEPMMPKFKSFAQRQMRKSLRVAAKDEHERIVGGVYSKPTMWPFVVAIYRNGMFHCGGSIYSDRWVISAAHCVINYQKYYYEVRAGVHRRSSYSVSTQIQPVSHVVLHQAYERRSMRNDLSMLRLAEPLLFNRWIKPICLPDVGRTTAGDDWIWGPEENTLCTAVGWGAIMEKGPASDQLREVVVPTRKRCTSKSDQEGENICAGYAGGGSDACQGDSGGPLFCRSVAKPLEWYLAGVVSHGNGCARAGEFGVYTRVALYLDWIEMAVRPDLLPKVQPKQLCPGYVCIWGGKRCIPQRKRCDRVINCLGGEDESGCIYNFIPDVGATRNMSTTEADYFPQDDFTTQTTVGKQRPTEAQTTEESLSAQTTTSRANTSKDADRVWERHEVVTTMPLIADGGKHLELKAETDQPPDITIGTPKPLDIVSLITTTARHRHTTRRRPAHTNRPPKERSTAKPTTLPIEETTEAPESVTSEETVPSTTQTIANTYATTTATSEIVTTTETEVVRTTAAVATEWSEPIRSTTQLPRVPPKIRHRTSTVQNATSAALPSKFVCRRITQIIEFALRCDRMTDCEDGSDEDDCSCRDFMKHPLDALICDGKVDCVDGTDELDCDYCESAEFLCPLSDACLPIANRCDGFVDCEHGEDEDKCLALTNGKQIRFDASNQVLLSNVGVLTRNVGGVWGSVCFNDATVRRDGATKAAHVCRSLGFAGAKFFSPTVQLALNHPIVPIEPAIALKPKLKAHIAVDSDNSQFVSAETTRVFAADQRQDALDERIALPAAECLGLYVECHAESVAIEPLKVLSAGAEVFSPGPRQPQLILPEMRANGKPNVFVISTVPVMLLERQNEDASNEREDLTIMVNNKLHEAVEELHWPWLVDIYANDSLRCAGVLLNRHWVMVHASCGKAVNLSEEYVAALFGGSKTRRSLHRSVEERIRRVDCMALVPNSDVLLYHLEHHVHFTHHIVPAFLPKFDRDAGDTNSTLPTECIALLHDNQLGHIRAVPMAKCRDVAVCRNSDMSCYRLVEIDDPHRTATDDDGTCVWVALKDGEYSVAQEALSLSSTCTNFGSHDEGGESRAHIDQGIMMCRHEKTSWYPGAMFQYNNTDCSSFKQPFGIRTLSNVTALQEIIDQAHCAETQKAPVCHGFRCPLGACLDTAQLCDGNNDCHDGSDESLGVCLQYNIVCKPSELRCRSSEQCIEKSKFCDHVPDCDDLTDEPTICSCLTYLQATEPEKICDGFRNCWDKSDERPAICTCTDNHFNCGTSDNECVPKDVVCDMQEDCPNGADEKYCLGIEYPMEKHIKETQTPNLKSRYGQVIEQSYGVWHTKCFPRSSPPNATDVREICKKLGYSPYRQPHYRLFEDTTNKVIESHEPADQWGRQRSAKTSRTPGKYRDSTKAIVASKFSPLYLNEVVTLLLRPSRPIAELVLWNTTDSSECLRLEINCT